MLESDTGQKSRFLPQLWGFPSECIVRRPCSDFMDMLQRLISCIIIIIINVTVTFGVATRW